MRTDAAIDIVARHVVARLSNTAEWEDFPDIGEDDWDRVVCHVDAIAPYPDAELVRVALAHLRHRAELAAQGGDDAR